MAHALVVGGTGMLRDVCRHLAAHAHHVSVVARSRAQLETLARDVAHLGPPHGPIHPLPVDYRDLPAFERAIRSAPADAGPVTLGVCWVHDPAQPVLHAVADLLTESGLWSTLVHVVGSGVADPSAAEPFDPHLIEEWGGRGVHYRRVILGFRIESATSSRWLTHAEIAAGVIRAITSDVPVQVVGTVEPWDRRPV